MSRDRGSATVWATLAATVLAAVFGGVLVLGQAVVARHRAASAADLAALAAAATWAHGPERACGAALRVAAAQGAALAACEVRGEVAEVTARPGAGPFTPAIRARAGPPRTPPAPDPAPAPAPAPAPDPGPVRGAAAGRPGGHRAGGPGGGG
ncbi:hypothetical protein AMK16_19340 [Streptomyces sp. CB00455]|uniref:Rv3654c family TadE-like protein n=1 Tax=Streptomyces sp. CB00455 TaxID=1703927 RepID=UPI00093FD889|nr:Rv3654c family TadE-like protein [Streptomyces sp. CB00455]OKK18447.1 hypothetical protein AMK16_19340 [Streptomyces sp. CB00455]